MLIYEKNIQIPIPNKNQEIFSYLASEVKKNLESDELIVRFIINETKDNTYSCELGIIKGCDPKLSCHLSSIFNFQKRKLGPSTEFNAVLMIPTGIGAHVGGHAGDAGPAAKLLAHLCDQLVTHPNAVNASDINELPSNGLYVEGSTLCRLLMGTVGLRKVISNRILFMIEDKEEQVCTHAGINAANAARATYGIDNPLILEMPPLSTKILKTPCGRASGTILNLETFIQALHQHKDLYDVVGISTTIQIPQELEDEYFASEGEIINPWGGIEALFTHVISLLMDVPSAHSPMLESIENVTLQLKADTKPVDPRLAAEWISLTYSQCLLKGLRNSPQIITDPDDLKREGVMTVDDISCLIMPDRCLGLPTLAALNQGIKVIAVRDESNILKNDLTKLPWAPGQFYYVNNYLEAAGVVAALKAGISTDSLLRPIKKTTVKKIKKQEA